MERKEGRAGVSPSQSNKVSLFGKNKKKKTQRGMRQNRVTVSSVAQHTHNAQHWNDDKVESGDDVHTNARTQTQTRMLFEPLRSKIPTN